MLIELFQIINLKFQSLPMVAQVAIRTAIKLVSGIQLPGENELVGYEIQELNTEFENLLDAIANRDTATVAMLYERWKIKPGGWIERLTARLMGFPIDPTMQLEDISTTDNGN